MAKRLLMTCDCCSDNESVLPDVEIVASGRWIEDFEAYSDLKIRGATDVCTNCLEQLLSRYRDGWSITISVGKRPTEEEVKKGEKQGRKIDV